MVVNRLQLPIDLPYDRIAEFCKQWKVERLEVFGSILGDDFGPQSDIDFLVTFQPVASWSLLDMVDARDELARVVGREVDLVTRDPIERSKNWMRRRLILESAQTIYVN